VVKVATGATGATPGKRFWRLLFPLTWGLYQPQAFTPKATSSPMSLGAVSITTTAGGSFSPSVDMQDDSFEGWG
jgi:hypothetical protein